MVTHVDTDASVPAPKLSDKPMKVTLLAHLGLLVLFTPVVMVLFSEVSIGHRLYIAFLASGLLAFGTLLLGMMLSPMLPVLLGIKPAKPAASEAEMPAGRLAAAA
jgi:hypothetical protein